MNMKKKWKKKKWKENQSENLLDAFQMAQQFQMTYTYWRHCMRSTDVDVDVDAKSAIYYVGSSDGLVIVSTDNVIL